MSGHSNGCGIFRTIDDQRIDPHKGGWREVKNNVHLCPTCINAAIKITGGRKSE